MRLDEVLLRDDRASQPTASSVAAGTLYFVTDEDVIEQSNGSSWLAYSGTGDAVVGPASATDNAIVRYDGTTGKLAQDSGITIADGATGTLAGSNSGDVTLAGTPDYITIAGQVITRGAVDLTADVSGVLPVANGGTGVSSNLGVIRTSTVTLTNAQILSLPTVPVTVIPAPGAGLINMPLWYMLKADFSGGAYTNIHASGYASFAWAGIPTLASGYIANDASTTPALTRASTFFGTATNWYHILYPLVFDTDPTTNEWGVFPSIFAVGDIDNELLWLQFNNNGAGNLTGGNAANTLKVVTYYTVEPI